MFLSPLAILPLTPSQLTSIIRIDSQASRLFTKSYGTHTVHTSSKTTAHAGARSESVPHRSQALKVNALHHAILLHYLTTFRLPHPARYRNSRAPAMGTDINQLHRLQAQQIDTDNSVRQVHIDRWHIWWLAHNLSGAKNVYPRWNFQQICK